MSSEGFFDPKFDKELNDVLLLGTKSLGCVECGKKGADQRCSRCQFRWYCGSECQRKDWKRHKEECSTFCENRETKNGVAGACMPILLKSVHFLEEESFVLAMRTRRKDFLKMIAKHPEAEYKKLPISFETAVNPLLGEVRIVAAAHFMDDQFNKQFVNHVLCEVVDEENDETYRNLMAGSGTISETAKDKVVSAWVDFARDLEEHGATVGSITVGRGVVTWSRDFEDRLDAALSGQCDKIITIPAMNHFFA